MAAANAAVSGIRPQINVGDAYRCISSHYGADTASLREIGSYQDRNFAFRHPEYGDAIFKVFNSVCTQLMAEAQLHAMQHVADAISAQVRIPQTIVSLNGAAVVTIVREQQEHTARAVTYVEGTPLSSVAYLSAVARTELGKISALIASSLATFDHPGLYGADVLGRQWDLRYAPQVIPALLPAITDAARSARVRAAADAAIAVLDPLRTSLRTQCIHGDITDDNVLGSVDQAGRLRPHAVIDWGDVGISWAVAELAITAASVLRRLSISGDPLDVLSTVTAFHAVRALSEAEVQALWPLIVLRACVLVCSGEQQAALEPENASATAALASEWRIFELATSLPLPLAEAAVRSALGFPPSDAWSAQAAHLQARLQPLFRRVPPRDKVSVLDLSSTSLCLPGGCWPVQGDRTRDRCCQMVSTEDRALSQEMDRSSAVGMAVSQWGEARLAHTVSYSLHPRATVSLGASACYEARHMHAGPTPVLAPADGTVVRVGEEEVQLQCHGSLITLAGLSVEGTLKPGQSVTVGQAVGALNPGRVLHAVISVLPTVQVPEYVRPQYKAAWMQLSMDPAVLFGLESLQAPRVDAAAVLGTRRDGLGRSQGRHYFASPPLIERGWKDVLVDIDCRCYVDYVNNVAAIGHSHPVLEAALSRQLHLLNTNSRFHYEAAAKVCQALKDVAPAGLDTVFLVNSGSEATDLALRMAQAVTQRHEVLCLDEAYHGVTYLSAAVTLEGKTRSTEAMRPPWVHPVLTPNTYRGLYRGPDACERYVENVRDCVRSLVSKGTPPAAIILEPLFGNAGGVCLPPGYLTGAFQAVRDAGGLCISDEVQVGLGRLGSVFWGHELESSAQVMTVAAEAQPSSNTEAALSPCMGARPDIVTIAKAAGNGFPFGAVLTTKAIAEVFAQHRGSFFSSAGGSYASCVAGYTVLSVLKAEKLQENARVVGEYLRRQLEGLALKHRLIGKIHGMGLYLGIELVRCRETLEPAVPEAYAICERMLELGVLTQPTSERSNVLKVKPPLCLTIQAADLLVKALDVTLTDGW